MLTAAAAGCSAPCVTAHAQFKHSRASVQLLKRGTAAHGRAQSRARGGAVIVKAGLLDMLSFRKKDEGFSSSTAADGTKEAFGGLGASISEGGREEQEDAYWVYASKLGFVFAGVYDGHMGSSCSKFLRDNMHISLERIISKDKRLLEICQGDGSEATPLALGPTLTELFATVDDMAIKHLATSSKVPAHEKNCGATATVIMAWPERLIVAHCGDTRAVLAGRNNSSIALTADHRPFGPGATAKKEIARVKETGGWVIDGRVLGLLAVSRAIGDPDFKEGRHRLLQEGVKDNWWSQEFANGVSLKSAPVISVPDLSEVELTPDHEFAIVATDGLWDVCSSSQAVSMVRAELRAGKTPQQAADALKDHAVLKRKTADNVSIVIVKLR